MPVTSTVVTITTTNAAAQTWTVPIDCPLGTSLKIEAWGAGSGGSGGNTSNRAGGAAGAYATAPIYMITPNDQANGISFTLKAGGAGSAGANSTVGPDTSFSTNNLNVLRNSVLAGGTVGTIGSGGAYWTNGGRTSGTGCNVDIVSVGNFSSSGAYTDVRIYGNPTVSAINIIIDNQSVGSVAQYTASMFISRIAGSNSNLTAGGGCFVAIDAAVTSSYLGTGAGVEFSPTTVPTQRSGTYTTPATTNQLATYLNMNFTTFAGATPVDITLRIEAVQTEVAAAPSFWKSTPGYTLAKGGSATSGTTGGIGGATASCIPTTGAFAGGSGSTRTQGGGGGGSAGKDGAGASATTGTGGTGDNALGGAANTSNVEGGGGATAGNPAGTAGDPGGGGGANTSTIAGTAGGRGQIRISYIPTIFYDPWPQRAAILAQ